MYLNIRYSLHHQPYNFIHSNIIYIYGSYIIKLHDLVMKCPTFEDYAQNAEEFYNYFL